MVSRRDVLKGGVGGAVSLALGGCVAPSGLSHPSLPFLKDSGSDSSFLGMLSQPLPQKNMDYYPEVAGNLPAGLSGTLFRNGPGIFERDGVRKRSIVDGDGMIRKTSFANGKVHFCTSFVDTEKYLREENARKFLYSTWTTPAPGLRGDFSCVPSQSQAGIATKIHRGTLFAMDEVGLPYGLDPDTLRTKGAMNPSEGDASTANLGFKAHTKTDGATGNWILAGQHGHVNSDLHVVVMDQAGKKIRHVKHHNPRETAYFHDFFWADPYAVFYLQPGELPTVPLAMLAGGRPYAECLEWKPEKAGQLFIVDTTGEKPPVTMEAPACWMWHTLNAHKEGNKIVGDFVGYDTPDHFIGKNAAFNAVMKAQEGVANSPGTLRRFTIDMDEKEAKMETVATGRFEFPSVAPGVVGQRHQYGYVASKSGNKGIFHDGLARVDMQSGKVTDFHFGPKHYVGEPIYAPNPAFPATDETHGWIIAEVLDGQKEKSFMAVFEAANLQKGPVAKVMLSHHLPISFHGSWEAAQDARMASNQATAARR